MDHKHLKIPSVALGLAILATACSRPGTSPADGPIPAETRCAGLQRVEVSNPLGAAVDVFATTRDGRTQMIGTVAARQNGSLALPPESVGQPTVRWSGPAGQQAYALREVRIRVTCY